MTNRTEVRVFQSTVALAAVIPIAAGAAGVLQGAHMIHGSIIASADLESHFRYLSGLLLGIGIGFLFTLPDLRGRASLFRALGLIVVVGGLARLLGAVQVGSPSGPHQFALVMELVVVPLLLVWHRRIACAASQHR